MNLYICIRDCTTSMMRDRRATAHNSEVTIGLHNITFVPLSVYHVPLYRFPFHIAR